MYTTIARRCLLAVAVATVPMQVRRGQGEETTAAVFVGDGTSKAVEVLGKKWTLADGYLECKGGSDIAQRLLGRCSIGAGDFHIKAKLALHKLANSAAAFTLGDNSYFGFAGAHGKVFVTGPWYDNARGTPIGEPFDFMQDGEPFVFEMSRKADQLRVTIDGKTVYEQKVSTGEVGAPGFTPVRSTMRIYSFSAAGNLRPYKAPKLPRRFRDNIVLDPRVKPVLGLPHGPFIRVADGGIMGVKDRNAIVTHDDGKTWEKRPIFGPDQKFSIRSERALLRTKSGAVILIFSNAAVLKYSWDKKKNVPKPDMLLPSYAIRSTDEGKTWTDLTLLHDGWCGCIQDIIQTSNGNVVVPGQELLYEEGRHATMPYVSTDDGKTWKRTRYLDIGGRGDHAGAIEGTLEELRDGRLWMLIRTYHGRFYESFSKDHGLTWNDPKPSRVKSTGSPGKMKRLASGRLVLLWNAIPNPDFKRREELSISFSDDDGKTWAPAQVFARNKGGRVSYPHLFEHRPGELWITTMQGTLRACLQERDFVKEWTKIVAFGDSTTAPRGKLVVYADILRRELPAKGVDAWVINSGVGGNDTNRARQRFERDVLAHKPSLAIIQFGINDAAFDIWKKPPAKKPRVSLARYQENLTFFIEQLHKQNAKVILMTPNPLRWTPKLREMYGRPPYDPNDPSGFSTVLKGYAAAARRLAQTKGVPLVDIYAGYEAYAREDGQSMDELLLDGMHPNAKGHRMAADLLAESVIALMGLPKREVRDN